MPAQAASLGGQLFDLAQQTHVGKIFSDAEKALQPAALHRCWLCSNDNMINAGVDVSMTG